MMWTVIQHGVEFGPAFGQDPGVIDEAVGELFWDLGAEFLVDLWKVELEFGDVAGGEGLRVGLVVFLVWGVDT